MSKPVILTGLRANNDLHIGNYFGALLPFIDMVRGRADEYQMNLFVPDLHSFTTPIDHSKLQEQVWHNLRLYVAAGLPLDHPDVHVYRQSYVPAHSELTWILDNFTGFGEMSRMTQFKDKSRSFKSAGYNGLTDMQQGAYDRNTKDASEMRDVTEGVEGAFPDQMRQEAADLDVLNDKLVGRVSVGLFNYPVLMAADILLYGAEYVPVGDDQSQHLEFVRDIAERMNNRFGELFVLPKSVKEQHEFFGKDQGLRIKDLVDPSKKMSKSDTSDRGIIFLGDDPEEAAKKIMSATTDSEGNIRFDFAKQPGVSNLIQIQSLLLGQPLEETIRHWEGKSSYGELKRVVAEAVESFLTDFQSRLQNVNDDQLGGKLQADEQAMNEIANATLHRVQQAVGLRPVA